MREEIVSDISMTQEQIEAVRARAITVRYSVITFAGHVQHKLHDEIADDLGALIKANEELRAEVERLQTTIKAFNKRSVHNA